MPITLPNVDRFSKLFHCQTQQQTRNATVINDPITSNASLHYLVKRKCQERMNNLKQMSCLTINLNFVSYS